MEQKPKPTIDSVALELYGEIAESDDKKLEAQIGLQKIVILGNYEAHGQQIEKIATTLCDDDYPATFLKRLPKQMIFTDFETEKTMLKKADILVIIDHYKGGVVSESTYLMDNPALLSKAILLVPQDRGDDKLFDTKNHYVYYSCKIKYPENKLVDIAVMAAKQASHRMALFEMLKRESMGETKK